jgi:hypothetical protein
VRANLAYLLPPVPGIILALIYYYVAGAFWESYAGFFLLCYLLMVVVEMFTHAVCQWQHWVRWYTYTSLGAFLVVFAILGYAVFISASFSIDALVGEGGVSASLVGLAVLGLTLLSAFFGALPSTFFWLIARPDQVAK